ncbi:MAG: hypothetical protein DRP01_02160 [Archaeoglobales archaeon]|nr:MAG: hypothetical protein DRP01_02160 [Archaeoglobales archaeon]
MALSISQYVDPGVYIGEVIEPGAVNVTSQRTSGLIAIAPRTRRSVDEQVVRGKVFDETLSLAVASPHVATLSNTSDRSRNEATLYMNGNELGLGDWQFVSAALVGTEWGGATVDVSNATGSQYLTLSVDGKRAVTIDFQAGQVAGIIAAAATASPTEVCAWINYELSNVAGTYYSIYGASYTAVATWAVGIAQAILTLTSPLTTSASDVKVFLSYGADAATVISNAGWVPTAAAGVQAPSIVQVLDAAYSSGATYTLDYVSVDTLMDALANAGTSTPLSDIQYAGSYPGGQDYVKNTDYEVGVANDLDWGTSSWAQAAVTTLDFVAFPPTIVAGTNDTLLMAINERTQISVTLTPGAPTTPAQVVIDINTALNGIATAYGPEFAHVAVVAGNTVVLTAPDAFENYLPEKGVASSIQFIANATDAFTTLFGIITQPYTVFGTGQRPSYGTAYFTTYDYDRPSTDYTAAHRVYDPDQLYTYCTQLTLSNYMRNKLCIAGEIAFENGASSLYLVQINDSTAAGSPTVTQTKAAIDVAGEYASITEVCTLDTSLDIAVYQMQHVASQSSMLEKHYRRGWFGMARDTDVGDPDTPDTYVYRATQTLQPGNNSPGRGRLFLVAPPNVSRTITLDTSQEITLDLDGTYAAVAVASVYTALPSPSSALIGKTITGFLSEGFGTYLRGERHTLASKGTLVVTLDAGVMRMIDPITTEAGGGGVVQFEEPASSAQKDAVTLTVDNLMSSNVVGIVPDDLSDFISDCKKWILLGILANITNGSIASYRDSSGLPRDIDAITDIQVYQSASDPRTFYFKYWYNLKYPAKRFFGEYSVDNPFFGPA